MRASMVLAMGLAAAVPATADESALAERVAAEMAADMGAAMGSGWSIRARWQDDALVAFVTPPVAQGWEIQNDHTRQREVTRALCGAVSQETLADMPEGRAIAVVPVILGKALTHLRARCEPAS